MKHEKFLSRRFFFKSLQLNEKCLLNEVVFQHMFMPILVILLIESLLCGSVTT